MLSLTAILARNQRILAGYQAGRSLLDLALAEQLDPVLVRRVLKAAGITPARFVHPRPTLSPPVSPTTPG